MGTHIHKRFDDEFVRLLFQKYVNKDIPTEQMLNILEIKKTRFFELLKKYRNDPEGFSIIYKRNSPSRISEILEGLILEELKKERGLITDKDIPINSYNYSYIRDQIYKNNGLKVSVPTIIKRAKENGCYISKKKRKVHDREVLTNYPGELLQHDSSHHKFSPYADNKWYLITTIDDFSRYMAYAKLIERETSWAHILSLEDVILKHGIPLSYYVDNHSIFRFVQGRDSIWRNHKKLTDEVTPQWKKVLMDLNVKVTYALSPQGKGKIERPYRWLQDRLVRTCAREHITKLEDAQEVLRYEVDRYNNHQVHSTTKEIPSIRLEKSLSLNQSMFREFKIPEPYESTKDIFCLRIYKTVDSYHKVSINNFKLRVKGVPLREKVEIRIVPDIEKGISELRFWYKRKLIDVLFVKNDDIRLVQF